MRLGVRVHVFGPVSVYGSIGTRRRRRRSVRRAPVRRGAPAVTGTSKTARKAVLWMTAAAVAGAALAGYAATASTDPAPAATVRQDTVADCTAAFEAQIRASVTGQSGHADMTTPAQCSGLTSSQVKQATSWALEATAP